MIARVALPIPRGKALDYKVPPGIEVAVGHRVRVPLGKRRVRGVVLEVNGESAYEGPLLSVEASEGPVVTPEALQWLSQVADQDRLPVGFCLGRLIPGAARTRRRRWVLNTSPQEVPSRLEELERRAPAQARTLRALQDGPLEKREVMRRAGVSADTIARLAEKGLVRPEAFEFSFPLREDYEVAELTEEQEQAIEQATNALGQGGVVLVVGRAGVGKTEVYLRALDVARGRGGSGLLLAPEVTLLPQLSARAAATMRSQADHFFGELAPGERWRVWRRALKGEAELVVGTRSAAFLPLRHPGLIVLDEEGEGQYKQELMAPYYDAREVAQLRAQYEGTAVLLGAAAPSVETYYRAECGQIGLARLTERVAGARPEVRTVPAGEAVLSLELQEAMERHLGRGGQVLLLSGRLGYFTGASCRSCGTPLRCPGCELAMVFHLRDRTFRCPACGATQGDAICQACGGGRFRLFGVGSQRVEQEARRLFPRAEVARLDSDTVAKRGDVLAAVAAGRIRIFVGSQMVSKGLDFPGISLVGVVNVDALLSVPDFRAGERAYQLLAGAVGRAGRGRMAGEVIVQTDQPEHYSVRHAISEDYEGFYREELSYREALRYPPFSRLAKLTVEGKGGASRANALAGQLSTAGLEILGPAQVPPRRGLARQQLLIRGGEDLVDRLSQALPELPRGMKLDVNPGSLV
ncbi:MAG: primosomal protein N' [Candidatus Bipolaricaulota bacterium]